MNRREFLRTAGGAAGGVAATSAVSGPAAAADGGGSGGGGSGPIDYGGWLEGAKGWGGDSSTVDKTGKKEVTIEVGANDGLAFKPAGVHIKPGTKVIWKWVDDSKGGHNVVGENRDFTSGSAQPKGTTYEKTFEKEGIAKYYCEPHKGMGMKGAVAVGSVPHKSAAAAAQLDPHEMGVPIQPHFVGFGAALMMMSTLVFTFYTLKYGESPHTKGGNN